MDCDSLTLLAYIDHIVCRTFCSYFALQPGNNFGISLLLELKSEEMRKSEVAQNSLEQRCARRSIERNTKARKLWDKAPDILMLRLGLQKALGSKMRLEEEEVVRNTPENTLGSILMDTFLGKSME